jgi:hypothetical protein
LHGLLNKNNKNCGKKIKFKLAIGSNDTNHSTSKYKENKEIYQTNLLTNYINVKYIQNITPNGSFCNFDLSTSRHCESSMPLYTACCSV